MSQRKTSILDKIGMLIPGYKGYAIRDEMRNTDKILRDKLSSLIQQSENNIIEHQQKLIKNEDMQSCKEWDISRKALNTLLSKVKLTTYGESSFFSENQLKEEELSNIYQYDLEISEKTAIIISKTIESEINEVLSSITILKQCKDIDGILTERTNYINQFK